MPEVNYDWVRLQLQESKTKIGVGNAVLKLLKAWEDLKLSEFHSQKMKNGLTLNLGQLLLVMRFA
ncbi:MAG: hypothetical protein EBT96_13310 [Betaproteobacteria bacterium]|nr:hypothetical protein [Betaproteobacteria bacterium]